jgi:site-specific recombinase XerD
MEDHLLLDLLHETLVDCAPAAGDETAQRWSQAFAAWQVERQSTSLGGNKRKLHINDLRAWRSLISSSRQPPWQIDHTHIAAWIDQLEAQGYKPNYIESLRTPISRFFAFCIQRRLLEGENPALHNRRFPKLPADQANYLNYEEIQALLAAVDHEQSIIGKRDYALLLIHLFTSMKTNEIRHLRWGDLDRSPPDGSWNVRRSRRCPSLLPLPAAVQSALHDYLLLSGRLETIQPTDYLFAPVAAISTPPLPGDSLAWDASRPLESNNIRWLLKRYAAWAGLDPRRLTCQTLANTALFISLQSGQTDHEIQSSFGFSSLHTARLAIRRQMLSKKASLWKARQTRRQQRTLHLPPFARRHSGGQRQEDLAAQAFLVPLNQVYEILEMTQAGELDHLDIEIMIMRLALDRTFDLANRTKAPMKAIRLYGRIGVLAKQIANLLVIRKQMGPHRPSAADSDLSPQWREMIERMQAQDLLPPEKP